MVGLTLGLLIGGGDVDGSHGYQDGGGQESMDQ